MNEFVSLLQGECNRCGLCCSGTVPDGRSYVCANLEVVGPLGTPFATRCKVYAERVDGMLIVGVEPVTGAIVGTGFCYLNSRQEDLAIINKGIGRGCSLTLKEAT